MSAIGDVITMLEGVRAEIAGERGAVDTEIARIREEAEQQVAWLVADIRDLETRDRMLVSAIATLHDVAARGRKASGAGEGDPSPRPSPARGEGEGALSPDERTVRAIALAIAKPAPAPVEAEPVDLPPPAPPRPVPAYEGVGVKAPGHGVAMAGDVVQVPLVDDRPGAPYVSEGKRLADRIYADLDILMADFPEGPTVRQLCERYEAPSSRVRDAMRKLQDARRASVHSRRTTGFQHLMRFGERP